MLSWDRDAVPWSDVELSDDFLVQLSKEFRLEEGRAAAAAESAEQTFKSF